VVGERALLEGGARTSTLRARTASRVAAVPFETVDRERLRQLAGGHRREDQLEPT
jgi:CRP-like cAMP-binding protein